MPATAFFSQTYNLDKWFNSNSMFGADKYFVINVESMSALLVKRKLETSIAKYRYDGNGSLSFYHLSTDIIKTKIIEMLTSAGESFEIIDFKQPEIREGMGDYDCERHCELYKFTYNISSIKHRR